jgi:uncharacterized damage-inducible protein DinB
MNHIYLADMVWYYRMTSQHQKSDNLAPYWQGNKDFEKVFENKKETEEQILKQCDIWLDFIQNMKPKDFEKSFVYSNTKGMKFEKKFEVVLDHLFNHGTHHR